MNAQLALGEVAANDFFHDYELARRSLDTAAGLIEAGEADYVVDELNRLKAKLLRTVGIEDRLRGWSQGIVTGKTLQEVTEEFAELYVTQVWLREDRKIANVSRQLAMSPKKVRRWSGMRHDRRNRDVRSGKRHFPRAGREHRVGSAAAKLAASMVKNELSHDEANVIG